MKLLIFLGIIITSSVGYGFWRCFRISAYFNTPEDYDVLNYGFTIDYITKYCKKHKHVAIINDGKLLGFTKEREVK